jgi:hypothetical protein
LEISEIFHIFVILKETKNINDNIMSKFRQLHFNPPVLNVKKDANVVIFNMVSCMCDNKSQIKFKKNSDVDFSMRATLPSGMGYSLRNYQMEHSVTDIVWEAEDSNWDKVIKMINSGTARIESVKSK